MRRLSMPPPNVVARRTQEAAVNERGNRTVGRNVLRAEHDILDEVSSASREEERNRLLRMLSDDDYAAFRRELTAEPLHLDATLIEADVAITEVYFPRTGVCSVIAEAQNDGVIEVGTIGCEGFIGLPVLLGADVMPYRTIVQIAGHAWRMPADTFRGLLEGGAEAQRLFLRFAQYYSDQLAQGVACNRLHTVDERCARWLLMTHDRVTGDAFELKQEYLALMLGVRRAGVSVAMGVLQSAGILQYARGRIIIRDRARLEEASCSCYHITQSAYQRLLG
jgi:CRP-like cAMP-binding protein